MQFFMHVYSCLFFRHPWHWVISEAQSCLWLVPRKYKKQLVFFSLFYEKCRTKKPQRRTSRCIFINLSTYCTFFLQFLMHLFIFRPSTSVLPSSFWLAKTRLRVCATTSTFSSFTSSFTALTKLGSGVTLM